jgi:hypothetical protein
MIHCLQTGSLDLFVILVWFSCVKSLLFAVGQYLLDSLLFFQQKGTHDALTDTAVAQGSSVHTRDGSDPLGSPTVFRRLQRRNAGQGSLAVTAFDRRALFVHSLAFENASRGTNGTELVLLRIVRVAGALARPTGIRHG